jgi:hypothetical protein
MKVKISKAELEQIIKEEVERYKTIQNLQSKKQRLEEVLKKIENGEDVDMEQLDELWGGLKKVGSAIGKGIGNAAASVGRGLKNTGKNFANDIARDFKDTYHGVKGGISNTYSGAKQGISNAANAVSNTAGAVKQGVQNAASATANTWKQGEAEQAEKVKQQQIAKAKRIIAKYQNEMLRLTGKTYNINAGALRTKNTAGTSPSSAQVANAAQ